MTTSNTPQKAQDNFPGSGGSNGSSRIVSPPALSEVDRCPPRIGLVLSSGGARGLAHIGVIQVLEENQIPIAAVAGSSMGGYIGSLHALGLSGADLEKLAGEIRRPWDLVKLLDLAWPPVRGLIHGRKVRLRYQRSMGETTFDQLQRPLYIVATDLDSHEAAVFHEGLVADAVHASCCIPGVCTPLTLDGRRYVDGGVVNPLPVNVLRQYERLDAVIAVSVAPDVNCNRQCRERSMEVARETSFWRQALSTLHRNLNVLAEGNAFDTLRNCLSAAQERIEVMQAADADVLLRPVSTDNSCHDYFRFQKYLDLGRQAAEAQLPAMLSLLKLTPANNPQPTQIHELGAPSLSLGRCA